MALTIQEISSAHKGAKYLRFAKSKLRELDALRHGLGVDSLQRRIVLPQGVTLFVRSAQFGDLIRISGGRETSVPTLWVNGVASRRSNRPRLLAYNNSPVARILYGSTLGTAYDSNVYTNNYEGPVYPILCEKTVLFVAEGHETVVVRVESTGAFPEFKSAVGGYTVWSAFSGQEKFIPSEARAYLFAVVDVPAGGFYSYTSEPEDFVTLAPDFAYSPWGFFVEGSEVVGAARFQAPGMGGASAWFDREASVMHLAADAESSAKAEFDIMRHVDPVLSSMYSGYFLSARYALGGYSAGGLFLQNLRVRVTVSGTGMFKLKFWGRYENAWPSAGQSHYLDEVPGFIGERPDTEGIFTCTGSYQTFELPIACFRLQDNTGSMDRSDTTGGYYTPAILEWGYCIESVTEAPLNLQIHKANLLTDFFRALIASRDFEYRTSESDTNMLKEHDLTLFDTFAAYTPEEFFAAFPDYHLWSNDHARMYTGYADEWFSEEPQKTYMLSHKLGYLAILSMREGEDLAGGYFSGPSFDNFPTWPDNFRIMVREFYQACDTLTVREVLSSARPQFHFSDAFVSCRLRRTHDYPSYPASSPTDVPVFSAGSTPLRDLLVDQLIRYAQPSMRRVHADSVFNFDYAAGTYLDAADALAYYWWDSLWPGNTKNTSASVVKSEGTTNILVPHYSALDPERIRNYLTLLLDVRVDCVVSGVVMDTQARNEILGALSTSRYNI